MARDPWAFSSLKRLFGKNCHGAALAAHRYLEARIGPSLLVVLCAVLLPAGGVMKAAGGGQREAVTMSESGAHAQLDSHSTTRIGKGSLMTANPGFRATLHGRYYPPISGSAGQWQRGSGQCDPEKSMQNRAAVNRPAPTGRAQDADEGPNESLFFVEHEVARQDHLLRRHDPGRWSRRSVGIPYVTAWPTLPIAVVPWAAIVVLYGRSRRAGT